MPNKSTSNSKAGASATDASSTAASKDADIIKAINALKTELKEDNERIRQNVVQLGQDLHNKLDNIVSEIQALSHRTDELESRVANIEDWALEATEALCSCLDEKHRLQAKLTDLESRSRRNNVRFFGMPEEAEGSSMSAFVEKLLRSELQTAEDFNFKIQRAHRSLAPKPRADAPPRPVIVNFLEFSTKEMVLREIWKKGKIQVGSRNVFVDHDFPPEIVKKRKEYAPIKKALKAAGVRFQTPFTNMRIHWESGVRTYNGAREAYGALKERGLPVEEPAPTSGGTSVPARLRDLAGWQRPGTGTASRRAKEKLRKFVRDDSAA